MKSAAAETLNRSGPKPQRSTWWIPAGLVLLGLVPAFAGSARMAEMATSTVVTDGNARFLAAPIPALLHIGPAIVFSLLGAFQFSPAFRRRHPRWHRAAGRVLVPAGLSVSISGLWMAVSYPWPAGDGFGVFIERLVFGGAMLVSMLLGVRALLRRRFKAHGDWMIRAYAIGMGAGTQVLTHIPWFVFVDLRPGETPRTIMMGLAWVVNLAVAEWIIRRPSAAHAPALATATRIPPPPPRGMKAIAQHAYGEPEGAAANAG